MNIQNKFQQAYTLHAQGNIIAAAQLYAEILKLHPNHLESLQLSGAAALQLKNYQKSYELLTKAINIDSNDPSLLNNRGLALQNIEKLSEALDDFNKALLLNPTYAEALNNKGTVLRKMGKQSDALLCFEHALKARPNFFDAIVNQGSIFAEQMHYKSALNNYNAALRISPRHVTTLVKRGDCLLSMKQGDAAFSDYLQATAITPQYTEAWLKAAKILKDQREYEKSINILTNALNYLPKESTIHNFIGNLYHENFDYTNAIIHYEKSINLDPKFVDPYVHMGNSLTSIGKLAEASDMYQKGWLLNKERPYLLGTLIHSKMKICDWKDFNHLIDEMKTLSQSNIATSNPFVTLSFCDDPKIQLDTAKIYFKNKFKKTANHQQSKTHIKNDRIRIGYISADFREHAVSYLTTDLFSLHDRNDFEVYGFSTQQCTATNFQNELISHFDHFHDISKKSDDDAHKFIQNLSIDIAIDLGGYTLNSRPSIFAMRCAPIQINFLGYPATTGSDVHDYIIADDIVAPLSESMNFSESIIQLPHSFQVNPINRPQSFNPKNRSDVGLPLDAFVFCAMNNSYKITPTIFKQWTQILAQTPNSILWLYADNKETENNLKKQATEHNISIDRLFFAPKLGYADHLQRYELADLFLDTYPYNAGTTASDALWMGLPVLTLKGNTFVSRMAASILRSVELTELISDSAEMYTKKAIELGNNIQKTQAIKKLLLEKRNEFNLFNTSIWVKYLEYAYKTALIRAKSGEAPQHIQVPDLSKLMHHG